LLLVSVLVAAAPPLAAQLLYVTAEFVAGVTELAAAAAGSAAIAGRLESPPTKTAAAAIARSIKNGCEFFMRYHPLLWLTTFQIRHKRMTISVVLLMIFQA
jgi:hypothetical protein